MNGAVLGSKVFESILETFQAVVPPTGLPASSTHSNAAPPQGCTSMPRWVLYQALRPFGSLDLKKIPPIPVTRFIPCSPKKEVPEVYNAADVLSSVAARAGLAGQPLMRSITR